MTDEKLDTPCTFQDGSILVLDVGSLEIDGVIVIQDGRLTPEGRELVDKPKRLMRWRSLMRGEA